MLKTCIEFSMLCSIIVFIFFSLSNAFVRRDFIFDRSKYVLDINAEVDNEHIHKVVFALKQRRLDYLEDLLFNVSNPTSRSYGKYLSSSQIGQIACNPNSYKALIAHLSYYDISNLHTTLYNEFVTVAASINVWEQFFLTKFNIYKHIENSNIPRRFYRATHYILPEALEDHIFEIFNLIHTPLYNVVTPRLKRTPASNSQSFASYGPPFTNMMTPPKLNQAYSIFSNNASSNIKQTIYSTATYGVSAYFSNSDLATFQAAFSIPTHLVDNDLNYRNSDYKCRTQPEYCAESNLDLQYILGVARNAYTTFIYDTISDISDPFVGWLIAIASTANPDPVYSISYGIHEVYVSGLSSYVTAFNQQAIKLCLMGVTLVAASGDDGAPGYVTEKGTCGYYALFPASSPYVLSVGATMGPERGQRDVVCQVDEGGSITSGGGFSSIMPAPAFQKRAVAGYFASVAAPASGYARNNRAYPDVSVAGQSYAIVIGGQWYSTSGTSASAPVVAGMISLVNAARKSRGLSTLGWINPAIYRYNGSFAIDVTSGHNKCAITKCCQQGFQAATGWDPATGFGAVNFTAFYNTFVNLGTSIPTSAPSTKRPSASPTLRPTRSSVPSRHPTTGPSTPSAPPSTSPSVAPSPSPSLIPTVEPSSSPSTPSPTVSPTALPSTSPSLKPTSASPSLSPTRSPTSLPSRKPTASPSYKPTTRRPTSSPTVMPTTTTPPLRNSTWTAFASCISGSTSSWRLLCSYYLENPCPWDVVVQSLSNNSGSSCPPPCLAHLPSAYCELYAVLSTECTGKGVSSIISSQSILERCLLQYSSAQLTKTSVTIHPAFIVTNVTYSVLAADALATTLLVEALTELLPFNVSITSTTAADHVHQSERVLTETMSAVDSTLVSFSVRFVAEDAGYGPDTVPIAVTDVLHSLRLSLTDGSYLRTVKALLAKTEGQSTSLAHVDVLATSFTTVLPTQVDYTGTTFPSLAPTALPTTSPSYRPTTSPISTTSPSTQPSDSAVQGSSGSGASNDITTIIIGVAVAVVVVAVVCCCFFGVYLFNAEEELVEPPTTPTVQAVNSPELSPQEIRLDEFMATPAEGGR